ncbi:hypothetical protein SODALDRAFT_74794 [Sodiomyces alkalinus F11]|uniref:Uncharacterized protein n=1 Tax=Sodiomyces alkalinus (strain CBS 110278 / VKM F-3762 / F11) TaxID=1314773 RepID=A0A3N2PKA0_SODAK|nr:hypothetical protein SODALDRAFT_74794 [Sodiomyces alkalinus F11]ROT34957.1 hypothetical protein SODALDRAFT_74794 [Sodiomyces alkalinus F11]
MLVRRQARVRTRDSLAVTSVSPTTQAQIGHANVCSSPTETIGKATVSTITSTTITSTALLETVRPQLNVSNFLMIGSHSGLGVEPQTPSGDFLVYDRAAPEEDLYGWDEELERHLTTGSVPVGPGQFRDPDAVDGRRHARASGPRRNLLRRVFHRSHASQDAVTSESRRTSNSSL